MLKLKKFLPVAIALLMITGIGYGQNAVTFQVNMNVQEFLGGFDPGAGDIVVVRGSFNGWGGVADQLTLDDTLYTYTADLAEGGIEYKFVIVPAEGDDVWEGVPNRTFDVLAGANVIDPVYFNDSGWSLSNIEVLFRVDMEVQILNGSFVQGEDWIVVRGAHESIGNWGGAVQLFQETGSTIYSDWIQFDNLAEGQTIEYKYVLLDDGNPDLASWEQSDNRSFTVAGDEPDNLPPPSGNGYGEITPDVVYFADITPADIITQDVLVEFHVDGRPAFYKIEDPDSFIIDVQTGDTVTVINEFDVAGFFNDWPWGSFDPEYVLNDDGVAPDIAAGDSIYATEVQFYAGDPKELIYKFGCNGYDVEAGFAENHSVIINDSNPTFSWPYDIFGSNGTLYDPYIAMLGVGDVPQNNRPTEFVLHQNYPNPFNPTTTISFTIPAAGIVDIKVFNVLGEEVFGHSTEWLNAGLHEIEFGASDLASGIYVYQVQTDGFVDCKKMMLLK